MLSTSLSRAPWSLPWTLRSSPPSVPWGPQPWPSPGLPQGVSHPASPGRPFNTGKQADGLSPCWSLAFACWRDERGWQKQASAPSQEHESRCGEDLPGPSLIATQPGSRDRKAAEGSRKEPLFQAHRDRAGHRPITAALPGVHCSQSG